MSEIVAILLLLLFGNKKRQKCFLELLDFCIFCSNIFFLHFLVHGKLQKHSSVSLFSSYVLFPFYSLTFVNDVGEALNSMGFHKDCYFSMRILSTHCLLLPCLVSSDIYSFFVYTKSFFRQEFSPSQSLTTFHVRYERS